MVTPLLGRDTLDRPAVERLLERLISGGVAGVFLLGTTGEGPGLSNRLRVELVDQVCSVVAGRGPVLVSITHTSMVETLDFAGHTATAGASRLLTRPPLYFPPSQADVLHDLQT